MCRTHGRILAREMTLTGTGKGSWQLVDKAVKRRVKRHCQGLPSLGLNQADHVVLEVHAAPGEANQITLPEVPFIL